jgi:hypothetical protein
VGYNTTIELISEAISYIAVPQMSNHTRMLHKDGEKTQPIFHEQTKISLICNTL